MHIFTSGTVLRNSSISDLVAIDAHARCAETGKVFKIEAEGITVNYATTQDGDILSNEGAAIRERRALLDAQPMGVYVSADNARVTDWKGNTLGFIKASNQMRLTRRSYTHGSHIHTYEIVDVFGHRWYGRGNPGIFMSIRPYKATRDARIVRGNIERQTERMSDNLAYLLNLPRFKWSNVAGYAQLARDAAHAAFLANPMLREDF